VLDAGETLAGLAIVLAIALGFFRAAVLLEREDLAYAGQVGLVACAVFLRVARPDIFESGLFARAWPLILVAAAFVSLGAGAVLRRTPFAVLAAPFERSASLAGLSPLLGVFFVGHAIGGSALFLSAALFGAQAAATGDGRRALLAAVLANIGLHPFLLANGLSYIEQPAAFFAPFGLTLIVAAQLMRDEGALVAIGLPGGSADETRAWLRQAGAFLVLASLAMTAYMDEPNRTIDSLALAALSVIGALAGLRLGVPSLVRLGVAFFVLDLASHLYWAGRERPWVWWVSLVALGAGVIAYMATLEKRRGRSE
jgi:hypothetical protein